MRPLFTLLTILFVVLGFFFPLVWILAAVSLFFAMATAPSGKREDGKNKTGGLLGGVWDAAVIEHKKQKGKL